MIVSNTSNKKPFDDLQYSTLVSIYKCDSVLVTSIKEVF